jgi:hypothetical protein
MCEGVTFYNGYLTSPDRYARAQFDADQAVNQVFERYGNPKGEAK